MNDPPTTGESTIASSSKDGTIRRRPNYRETEHVSQQVIDTLQTGITMGDVERRFGPGLPVDSPMRVYYSADGILFSFLYLPTNELHVDLPVDERGHIPIVAIVMGSDMEEVRHGGGVYVFPPQVKGKNFTGLKLTGDSPGEP